MMKIQKKILLIALNNILPMPNYFPNNFNGYFGPYPMFNPYFQTGVYNMNNMNNYFGMSMGMNQMANLNFQPGINNMANINNNINLPMGMNPFGYSMQPTNPNNDNKNGK